jgi:glycosyltransferase involved in cell wall biosynthesis
MCPRYSKEEVDKIECPVFLANISLDYFDRGLSILKKMYREVSTNYRMYKLIVQSNADIIHANDLNALIPAYFASRKMRSKLVYDSHEIFIENPWVAKFRILHGILFWIERKLLKKVDLLINVSHAASDYMGKLYNVKSKIVVTNCISHTSLSSVEMQTKHPCFEVLNHGQFYIGRGYDILVRTAPLLIDIPEIKLVLRGFGPMEELLRNEAKDYDNVLFSPPVKTNELIQCASASHVGIAIT